MIVADALWRPPRTEPSAGAAFSTALSRIVGSYWVGGPSPSPVWCRLDCQAAGRYRTIASAPGQMCSLVATAQQEPHGDALLVPHPTTSLPLLGRHCPIGFAGAADSLRLLRGSPACDDGAGGQRGRGKHGAWAVRATYRLWSCTSARWPRRRPDRAPQRRPRGRPATRHHPARCQCTVATGHPEVANKILAHLDDEDEALLPSGKTRQLVGIERKVGLGAKRGYGSVRRPHCPKRRC